ncbi:hypothetical protein, partial [Enterobacter roggenkampii]|jgi:hypothetical protein
MVCVVGRMRDLILQLSKSSIYSTKPDGNKQKGTIVVSTEKIFDGNNKEHIGKANDIEIKLLDLGFLPLITEL